MKSTKKYIIKLEKFLEKESSKGINLINIKQQKKGKKTHFKIHPIYKNYSIQAINTERSTMPGDTVIPLRIFEIVIEALLNEHKNEYTLFKGNAQKKGIKIGDPGLEKTTLESIVAINYYKKKKGETVYRRIPVISNILAECGICENIRKGSRLKLIID